MCLLLDTADARTVEFSICAHHLNPATLHIYFQNPNTLTIATCIAILIMHTLNIPIYSTQHLAQKPAYQLWPKLLTIAPAANTYNIHIALQFITHIAHPLLQ